MTEANSHMQMRTIDWGNSQTHCCKISCSTGLSLFPSWMGGPALYTFPHGSKKGRRLTSVSSAGHSQKQLPQQDSPPASSIFPRPKNHTLGSPDDRLGTVVCEDKVMIYQWLSNFDPNMYWPYIQPTSQQNTEFNSPSTTWHVIYKHSHIYYNISIPCFQCPNILQYTREEMVCDLC